VQSIHRRFDSKSAIIAAITVPKFKLRWVETQQKKDSLKQMLLDEMPLYDHVAVVEEESQSSQRKKIFTILNPESDTEDTVESEARAYLSKAKKVDCLHNYPIIKRLFLKYNTTLPSSAPLERLFSLGSLV